MAKELYSLYVQMSDGYYSVDRRFNVLLDSAEWTALSAELGLLYDAGSLQVVTLKPLTEGADASTARAQVIDFIKAYPQRKFGGPGGVG